jgi:cysteine desulfurase NifS
VETKVNEKRAICGICPAGCWVVAGYDDEGRLSSVRADETSLLGNICELGRHSVEIVYSENRLTSPLRRKGPKGSFEFEKITWDEAFTEITDRLRTIRSESGPEAAAIYTGRGSFELSMCDIFQPAGVAVSSASSVLFPFGSPNTMGVGALCYVSYAMIAPHVTMGGMLVNMFSDIENADLVVVWGANPATDSPPVDLDRTIRAKARGAEVVVIDPRRTLTAKRSDARWIPIRPGTDGALALGICHVLIAEELYDEAFVRDWTKGFEEFRQYTGHFRPEVVSSITGVPESTIHWLAEKIATARGASPLMYTGLEYSDSGVQAIRAVMVLWALAGQLDVPGGRCFTMPQNVFPINRDGLIPNPDMSRALGRGTFPVYSAYRGESHANAFPASVLEGDPYRIRSLIILGASIITSWPQPGVWREALNALDFLVCIDVNLTADCAYADIVLPAATWYEIRSYMRYGPVFRIREKVIEPVGQSRNAFLILAELADRLGYGHLFPQSEEAVLRHALAGSPFTLEEVLSNGGTVRVKTAMMEYKKWEKGLLRTDGKPGFDTPTGKFEIASTVLEEHGYDPLPVYTEPREGPQADPGLARGYPLVFVSGSRVSTDFRSQFHHIPGLVKERSDPTVMMNIRDARARGIEGGDEVIVRSPRGEVRMRAVVTEDIVQGAVDADMGGGGPLGPEAWQRCNINELTDLRYDPISGFPVYKALLCEVVKASTRQAHSRLQESGPTPRTSSFPPPSASSPASSSSSPASSLSFPRKRESSGSRAFVKLFGYYPDKSSDKASAAKRESPEPADRIYLDNNATTAVHPDVCTAMEHAVRHLFGNASAIHTDGRAVKVAIEDARRRVAKLIGSTARRIVFTGGGSEANNQVIKGIAFASRGRKRHIITTSIEHPSVLMACEWLQRFGFRLTYLPVDGFGLVNPEDLRKALTSDTLLVSVMTANNETGTVQPIAELASIARERGALFHTDAVQAVGKIPIDAASLGVDFLTLSSHKFHGPKGVGAIYIRYGIEIDPLIHGGRQEHGLRAGTENSIGIIGLGRAAELAERRIPEMSTRVRRLRDELEQGIMELVPGASVNGHPENRLPHTLNISLPGIRGESMVIALDARGISLSSGSACRSGSPRPSHALTAMGLSNEQAHCALRFSLGAENTKEQICTVLSAIEQVISESMHTVRFVSCR